MYEILESMFYNSGISYDKRTYHYFAEDLNGRADVQTEGAKSESRKFQRFKLCVSH